MRMWTRPLQVDLRSLLALAVIVVVGTVLAFVFFLWGNQHHRTGQGEHGRLHGTAGGDADHGIVSAYVLSAGRFHRIWVYYRDSVYSGEEITDDFRGKIPGRFHSEISICPGFQKQTRINSMAFCFSSGRFSKRAR